jgi:uncharacterized Tic20 family protein
MTSDLPPPLPERDQMRGNDKIWILASHLSIFLGAPFLIPLIVYLAMKNDSEVVAYHAKESLNFHLSCLLYGLVCIPLCFFLIGIPLLIVLGFFSVVMAIVAAIKASDGIAYRYPLTIRFF